MLHELDISDFAIIQRTTIQFAPGLNALTGETGAGKSILLDALGAVLGSRVSSDLVRTGAPKARVEAQFEVDDDHHPRIVQLLSDVGIDAGDDSTLILTREILATGRSSARVNGRPATTALLATLGEVLVDIHGQSDHLAILKPSVQRTMVDRFARHPELVTSVSALYGRYRTLRNRIDSVTGTFREQEQRIDLLRFQTGEIEAAELEPGEDERLKQERTVLENADRLRLDATRAVELLAGDPLADETVSGLDLCRQSETLLNNLQHIDSSARSFVERATGLVALTEDLGRDIRRYLEGLESDPARLQEVEDRLAVIQQLFRKYGQSIEEVLDYRKHVQEQLTQLTGSDFDLDALSNQLALVSAELSIAAGALSTSRTAAAASLSKLIVVAIKELRMGSASLDVKIRHEADSEGIIVAGFEDSGSIRVDAHGADEIAFLVSTNSGEALKPLARIASGGETARFMLALKSILSVVDTTPTLVFDEIDVGVGGRSGAVVGEKLKSLSRTHQVIVVTHLPQIAAFADAHLRILKFESEHRTVSIVQPLDQAEQILELAAMIDGQPVTPPALDAARAMVKRARQAVVGAS